MITVVRNLVNTLVEEDTPAAANLGVAGLIADCQHPHCLLFVDSLEDNGFMISMRVFGWLKEVIKNWQV